MVEGGHTAIVEIRKVAPDPCEGRRGIAFTLLKITVIGDRALLGAVSELAHCNPFLPERIDLERSVLGPEFLESEPVWSMQVDDPKKPRANSWRVHEHVESLVDLLRQRLLKGVPIGHQLDVGPHHVTHLSRSGEILSHRIAADTHLEGKQTAVDKFESLFRVVVHGVESFSIVQ